MVTKEDADGVGTKGVEKSSTILQYFGWFCYSAEKVGEAEIVQDCVIELHVKQ